MNVAKSFTRFPQTLGAFILTGAFLLSTLMAFLLRFDLSIPPQYLKPLLLASIIYTVSKLAVFVYMGQHRLWWRYVSTHDVLRLMTANAIGSVLGSGVIWFTQRGEFPRSVLILDFILCCVLTGMARMLVKISGDILNARHSRQGKMKAVIYGAGDGGVILAREIRQNPALSYHVIGFVDDDPAKKGAVIDGVRVFGSGRTSRDWCRGTTW